MIETTKVTSTHLSRAAYVYVRQSTAQQVERNRESTDRQYGLVDRAVALGWSREAVKVVDDDLGVSGAGTAQRAGFAAMTAEVALGHVGIVLGLEVSRLARNNADWYRLLDLCALAATLIGDADGVYDTASINDRLVLGLKGTMSEVELHTLRARLAGGIRNKAERGELRRALPTGLIWGPDGIEVHPDEAVRHALAMTFERFAELGSARAVWLWFRTNDLQYPGAADLDGVEIRWTEPTYTAVHRVLTHPAYAGAYTYGKKRSERYLSDIGDVKVRRRALPMDEWQVLIRYNHHGYIDWDTYMANRERLEHNIRPRRHESGTGSIREGTALLQGIARCGNCGRKLATHYRGRNSTPGYHCAGKDLVNGRGVYCLNIGGVMLDKAVADAFCAALTPAGLEAALAAEAQVATDFDAAFAQHERSIERLRYEARKAERRYLAVDTENRLVARGLEADWEQRLEALQAAEADLETRRRRRRPQPLTAAEHDQIRALAHDMDRVWTAPTTTDRDRKELLHTLLEEVTIHVKRDNARALLTLRWRGGTITDLTVDLPRSNPPTIRTDDDTIELIGRLAHHYPDEIIAGILNRQGRLSATGQRFTAGIVQGLRHHRNIPRYQLPAEPPDGEVLTIAAAARLLEVAPSTLHRWLHDGFIPGEQPTPGAPWQIRITDDLKALFVDDTPDGWLAMLEATLALGVSRQTIMQRVKRGELNAVLVRKGKRKGLRIQVKQSQPGLFDTDTMTEGAV